MSTKQSLNRINKLTTFDYMPGKKDETISIRIDEDLLHTLDDRAARYQISRANLIRRLLEDGLRKELNITPSSYSLDRKISALEKDMAAMKETLGHYKIEPDALAQETMPRQSVKKKPLG